MIFECLPNSEGLPHDVCIIGAGPVGLTLALELVRAGKRVVVLESGGEAPDPKTQALSRAEIIDPRVHDEVEIAVSRQLGGTSNLWGARCQPFDAIDFVPRDVTGNARWPIDFDDLLPHYPAACSYANCGSSDFVLAAPHSPSPEFEIDRIERFSRKPEFQNAHSAALRDNPGLLIHLNCTVTGIRQGPEGRAHALNIVGRGGEKCTFPVNCVVLAMGGLETARLLLNVQAEREELFGGVDGALGRYYMAHLVGEVSDISWVTEKTDESFDFLRDPEGGYLRRRIIPSDDEIKSNALPNVSFWPVVPGVADARHNDPLLSLAFLALAFRPLGNQLVAEAIRRYHAPPGTPILPHLKNVLRGIPKATWRGTEFLYRRTVQRPKVPGFFIRNPAKRYGLSYHAEHLPARESHVRLSREIDVTGMKRLIVDLRFTNHDADALTRAHQRLSLWLEKNKLGSIQYRQPEYETSEAILANATHGTHQIGLVRMGRDRRSAVVDADLRSFDIRNLYVVGSSVFVTSGQANPTLTAVALAVRLAKHLANESF